MALAFAVGLCAAAANAEPRPAFDAFLTAFDVWKGADEPATGESERRLIEAIDHLSLDELLEARGEAEDAPHANAAIHYRLGRLHRHWGRLDEARLYFKGVVDNFPADPFAARARADLARLDARQTFDPHVVGVLLPLSGRYKSVGEQLKQAIDLAAAAAQAEQGGSMRFIYADTQGEPGAAAAAVDKLVHEDRVAVIVGPLVGDDAEAAAYAAERLGVAMVSLSQREGLPQIGTCIFRVGMTMTMQAKAAADYAIDVLGLKRFAILYPSYDYGEDLTNAFWDAVRAKQGFVVGAERYDPGETTFKQPVRRLAGRYRVVYGNPGGQNCYDSSGLDCGAVRTYFSENMPPVVDFDAIFIPDNAKTVGMIAPAIPFEEIEIDTRSAAVYKKAERMLRRTGRELKLVQLLGASGWNHPALARYGGKWVEGAFFPDGFYAGGAANEAAARFVAEYKKAYQREPTSLEAYAYDAAMLASFILSAAPPKTRRDVAQALDVLERYPGVTGDLTFDAAGEMQSRLVMLTVKDGQIVPAPKTAEELPSRDVDSTTLYEDDSAPDDAQDPPPASGETTTP